MVGKRILEENAVATNILQARRHLGRRSFFLRISDVSTCCWLNSQTTNACYLDRAAAERKKKTASARASTSIPQFSALL